MKFVQSLAKQFSNEVLNLINDFVNSLMAEYSANRRIPGSGARIGCVESDNNCKYKWVYI